MYGVGESLLYGLGLWKENCWLFYILYLHCVTFTNVSLYTIVHIEVYNCVMCEINVCRSHTQIEQSAMHAAPQSSSTVRQAPPSSTGTSNLSSIFSPITINSFIESVGPTYQVSTSAADVTL